MPPAKAPSLFNIHTKESLTVTFKTDGRYDADALKQLNHFMRDWRRNESREMDPELIDLIWTLREELGSKEPVKLISAYRSATTNNKLRRKGGGQAKNSQHIQGKAADIQFPDVPVKRSATLRSSRSGAASVTTRPQAFPSCMSTPAACACGRASPASSSLPSSPRARPNIAARWQADHPARL